MIVVAIGAILAAVAIPGLRDTLNTTRQSTALGLVMSDLNQARGEAIKRNARMLVCAGNAGGTDCSGSTNWRVGWLVCREGGGGQHQCAATPRNPNPVLVRPPLTDSLTLTATDGSHPVFSEQLARGQRHGHADARRHLVGRAQPRGQCRRYRQYLQMTTGGLQP